MIRRGKGTWRERALCAALLCLLALAPAVARAASLLPEDLNGTWLIDVDKTLAVNEIWHLVYDRHGPEGKSALRTSWVLKELVIDMTAHTMEDRYEGRRVRLSSVSEIHNSEDGGLRMAVRSEGSEPYFVTMSRMENGLVRLVIEDKGPIILFRSTKRK